MALVSMNYTVVCIRSVYNIRPDSWYWLFSKGHIQKILNQLLDIKSTQILCRQHFEKYLGFQYNITFFLLRLLDGMPFHFLKDIVPFVIDIK